MCSGEGKQTEQVGIERTLNRAPDVHYGEVMPAASWCGKGLGQSGAYSSLLNAESIQGGFYALGC